MDTERARRLRKRMTEAERFLWYKLRCRQLSGMKFRRQQPKGPFIVDFVCFEHRMIVEVDGGQHAEQALHDMQRSRWLEAQGYRVLRFWNNEVLVHIDAVTQAILDCIETRNLSPTPTLPHKEGGN